MSRLYSTKEAAEVSGVAVETVRYYCKIGLVPRVVRDENNYRVFDDHDIAWLKGLHCLRECGMTWNFVSREKRVSRSAKSC